MFHILDKSTNKVNKIFTFLVVDVLYEFKIIRKVSFFTELCWQYTHHKPLRGRSVIFILHRRISKINLSRAFVINLFLDIFTTKTLLIKKQLLAGRDGLVIAVRTRFHDYTTTRGTRPNSGTSHRISLESCYHFAFGQS